MKKNISLLGAAGLFAVLNAQTAGNVGINTANPINTLTVKGNLSVGSGYAGTHALPNGAIIEGNTGIGTSAPLSKLDVVGQTKLSDATISPKSTPIVASLLELSSSNKGLRLPQVSLTSTTSWSPLPGTGFDGFSQGMTVYNTNASIVSGNNSYPAKGIGEYYWDGTGWIGKNTNIGAQNAEVFFSVYRNTYQSFTNGVWAPINFSIKTFDKNSNYDLASSSFTVPLKGSGFYQINASYTTEPLVFLGQSGRIGVFVNGFLYRSLAYGAAPGSMGITAEGTAALSLNPGDVVSFQYLAVGSDQNVIPIIDFYQISR